MVLRKLLGALLAASTLFGASIADLKATLQKLDSEATKTKENIFYLPYIMSVYKGEELESVGVTKLYEALELIPGVYINSDNLDIKTAIFRGSNPYAYGQTKLFIDGVCVNDVGIDQYSNFLEMPIELIKRIEIVRGPGNRTDEVNVYAGAIYVYTYAECECSKERYFVKKGSFNTTVLGAMRNFKFSNGATLYLEGYMSRDDRHVHSGKDILATGYFGPQNVSLSRSGDAPLWLRNYSLALTFKYEGLTVKARDLYYKHGHAFGLSYTLPQKEDFYRLPMRYVEAAYKKEVAQGLDAELKVGVKFSGFYSQSHLAPEGIIYKESPCPDAQIRPHSYGIYGIYEAKQRSRYAGLKFMHHLNRHELHYGIYAQKDETYSVTSKRTDPNGVLIDYSATCPFTDPNAKRTRKMVYFFDEFHYSERLSFSYGFNFEKNENTDGEFNPRLAVVYQAARDKIFKFSYSRSHRNPSWQELFVINNYSRQGNPDLRPEVVHALEGSYIKRFGMDDYLQTSLFYLKNDNVIDNVNEEHEFRNRSSVELYGFELELKKTLSETMRFYGNYSYVDGRCSCDKRLPNIAHHMAKFYLLKQLSDWSSLSLVYMYIGERERAEEDERPKLDATQRVDMALDLRLRESVKLTFAVKNLFDEDIRYPSPPNTYVDDYPAVDGRSVIATLKWSF